jgi:hypothetical protein
MNSILLTKRHLSFFSYAYNSTRLSKMQQEKVKWHSENKKWRRRYGALAKKIMFDPRRCAKERSRAEYRRVLVPSPPISENGDTV